MPDFETPWGVTIEVPDDFFTSSGRVDIFYAGEMAKEILTSDQKRRIKQVGGASLSELAGWFNDAFVVEPEDGSKMPQFSQLVEDFIQSKRAGK